MQTQSYRHKIIVLCHVKRMKTRKAAASHKAIRTPRQQVAGLRQALPGLPKLLVVFLKHCCGCHNFDPMDKAMKQLVSILETLLRV